MHSGVLPKTGRFTVTMPLGSGAEAQGCMSAFRGCSLCLYRYWQCRCSA